MSNLYFNSKADYLLRKEFCVCKKGNQKCYRIGCKDHSENEETSDPNMERRDYSSRYSITNDVRIRQARFYNIGYKYQSRNGRDKNNYYGNII